MQNATAIEAIAEQRTADEAVSFAILPRYVGLSEFRSTVDSIAVFTNSKEITKAMVIITTAFSADDKS